MKILALFSSPVFGGPERYAISLHQKLQLRGHDVIVACSSNLRPYFQKHGIRVYSLNFGPKLSKRNVFQLIFMPIFAGYLVGLFLYLRKKENINLIFSTYKKEQLIGTIAANIVGLPIVWREAGPLPSPIPDHPFWQKAYAWGAEKATHIIGTCQKAVDSMVSVGVSTNKITRVYTGVDLQEFQPTPKTLRFKPSNIGIVARLSGLKGHDILLRAMRIVLSHEPLTHLFVIGDGSDRSNLEKLTENIGLTKNVEFSGFVENVIPYLDKIDIFVLPSQGEGLPISIIEAMAKGLPVVASCVGGIPELVINRETGFLIKGHSPELLAKKILKLVQTPNLAYQFGKRARKRAKEMFSQKDMINKIEKIFLDSVKSSDFQYG